MEETDSRQIEVKESGTQKEVEKKLVYEGRLHAWIRTIAIVICAVFFCIVFFRIMPVVSAVSDGADGIIGQVNVILDEADDALGEVNGAVYDIKRGASNMNDVLDVIKDADLASVINSLHNAVDNLNTVIKPLAGLMRFGG